MGAQGLLDPPDAAARAGAGLLRLVERLGFVQIDSINVVERAHHLILHARSDAYAHAALDRLAGSGAGGKKLFEHWTHDASFIPTKFFAQWRPRFERYEASPWLRQRLGPRADAVVAEVRGRIEREGPLRSKDFEAGDGEKRTGGWWNWKPHKAALEYLWRAGELYVVGRDNFHKVYDLTARAAPELHALPRVGETEHVAWACRSALERLGVATAREVAAFWHAIPATTAIPWLRAARDRGEVIELKVEGEKAPSYALTEVTARLRKLREPPHARLLCPFDPVVRDRARLKRLFDFDYRFEAFVPEAKRKHGYYVLPILRGDRFVGRLDPKFDRDRGTLVIRKVWWEAGVDAGALRAELELATARLAKFIGAERVEWPAAKRASRAR